MNGTSCTISVVPCVPLKALSLIIEISNFQFAGYVGLGEREGMTRVRFGDGSGELALAVKSMYRAHV